MKNHKLFIASLIVITSCPVMADDDLFYENLIHNNVKQTAYSALIKTVSADPVIDIRTDSGKTGYITYRFIAEVLLVYKGKLNSQIEYHVTYEADIKPVINNKLQIISLCYSKDNKFYVPDNGYRINATEKLMTIAKQATSKRSSLKSVCDDI